MGIRSRKRKTIFRRTCDPPSCRRRKVVAVHHLRLVEWRDWAALPHDVLCEILNRVPQPDILRGAGLACSSWRRLAAHEPFLWGRIDLADGEEDDDEDEDDGGDKGAPEGWQAIARAAVQRSAGRCESFRGRVDGDFLLYLAHSAPLLRSLHVTCRFGRTRDEEEKLMAAMKKFHLLEPTFLF